MGKIKIPERAIENQILSYLRLKGIFAWKNTSGGYFDVKKGIFRRQASKYAIRGTSDILGIHKGRFIAIEVKSRDGRVSEDQKLFIEAIRKNGGISLVARCLEDVCDSELFTKTADNG